MAKQWLSLYLQEDLRGREEVYHFLADCLKGNSLLSEEDIISQFLIREEKGSIQIADGVILPHFQEYSMPNQIIMIRLLEPITNWSDRLSKVRLVIALVTGQNGRGEQEELRGFIRQLASDDYIDYLLEADAQDIRHHLS